MPNSWSFFTSGQLVFGPGAIEQLGDWFHRHQLKRILVVTDQCLRQAGVVLSIEEQLQAAQLEFTVLHYVRR